MVGNRLVWVAAAVVSLIAHAGAAAILTLSPAQEQDEALIAGGVVAEVAMLGSGAFEAVESGAPEEVVRPEDVTPEEIQPVAPEVAEVTPQEIEPLPIDPSLPVDAEAVAPESVEPLEVPGAEVEVAAIPIPEIKPEVEPERQAEAIQPVPEKKIEKPVERKKPVKKAGEKGKSRQTATRGQVDGSADVKTAALGGQKKGNASTAGNAAVSNYPGKVRSKINRSKRRVSGGHSGSVVVSFVVSSSGSASGIRVARSSGVAALDKAALDSIRRASPFPKIPPAAERSSWSFSVPIVFN
ncbi:TonB family protein [Rhizobium sp. TRM95111]|uniref:energy transducer TonB family protein n=1 Tax=Rhizobium alarense TaxID=2846851 RepID=UPI001F2A1AC9|nr:energy transducer TonB [Rhizobium alarense]MCF3643119.1 TonB family protein [Rhizobium alarense]